MKSPHFNITYKHLFFIFISVTLISCGADDVTGVNISGSRGSISLTWIPPTTNNDGSTLTNLDGYKVYYGPSSDSLNDAITIDNEGVTEYQTDDLLIDLSNTDTYYFAVTAFNSLGLESPRSNIISKQFTN